jgi:hypothetical protein
VRIYHDMATMTSQTESHHALWQASRQGSRDLKKRRRDRRAPPDTARLVQAGGS